MTGEDGMERDKSIDVMKGILIVLVVMAHAQGPGYRFIYLFHMATFFMISGYLWKTRSNLSKVSVFIRRKIKSLYFHYVICNGAFLLIFLLLPSIFDVAICEKTWGGN